MKSLFDQSWRTVARVAIALALICAVFTASACSEEQYKTVATNVDRVALLIQDGREIRDELFAQGVIDGPDAYRVTIGLRKVNNAVTAFSLQAQTYKAAGALTPDGRERLKVLANGIANAATELISDGTFGVKNPDAAKRINAVIGALRQATLAIVDAVTVIKTKPATPVQQAGMPPEALLALLLMAVRQTVGLIQQARTHKELTADETFANADAQLESNDMALAADLLKYAPEGEPTPEQDAFIAHLEKFEPAA